MAEERAPENQGPAEQVNFAALAQQRFGRNFHGEVPEPKEEPAAAPEEPEQEAPEAGLLDAEPPEDATETGEEQETEQEEEEGEYVQSFSELIESQQWDPEWVKGLRVPVKVDGVESEATFDEIVRSYQTQTAAEKRLEEAKEKAREVREAATQREQAAEAQITALGALITNAEKLVDGDAAAIDWQKLRADDPAEYAVRKQEIQEKRERINTMKREALQQWQSTLQQQQAQEQQQKQEQLRAEQQALLQALPDWQDPEKAKAEQTKLVGYLTNQGFAQEDVLGASDHRLILLARKAMLYDQKEKGSNVAAKKLAKVPKVLKPGSPKPQEQVEQERVQQTRARLRKSGKLDDAMALLKSRRQ